MYPTTIFDIEVTAYDWLVTFKEVRTGKYFDVWNDNELVRQYIKDNNTILCGFNNKHYDNYILKAILMGFSNAEVKAVNDAIIGGKNGWELPQLSNAKIYFDSMDLMDDMQAGISLKYIEGSLGQRIVESDIDFDIDRPLTDKEQEIMQQYCHTDVNSTELLFTLRQGYLENKVNLGLAKGINPTRSLYMTNAKLTAAYLDATPKKFNDRRNYVYPDNLLKEYIPQEVFEFFNRLFDKNLTDDEVFGKSLDIMVGECPVTIGFGGIHGAEPNYTEESNDVRTIRNKDVASYYPHLMTLYNYTSRTMPNAQIYSDTLKERVKAKKSGDKSRANALKLVLNTTYGATLDKYNALYDPLKGMSVCITGQLFLLELAVHLLDTVPGLKVIQLNTDGIMVSFPHEYEHLWQEITSEWESRTGFTLEEDFVKKIVQKDVNNYIEVADDGNIKVKGGALVRGVLTNGNIDFTQFGLPGWTNLNGGAWKVNNNACIVSEAIIRYFTDGIKPEKTINNCDDIFQFQIIAKASHKYSESWQEIDGKNVPIQRCNRVYASPDKTHGTLYKKHKVTGGTSKQAGLPLHCVIDNDNKLTIADIDKTYYIKEAKRIINEFIGGPKLKLDKRKINKLIKQSLQILEEEKTWQQPQLNLPT